MPFKPYFICWFSLISCFSIVKRKLPYFPNNAGIYLLNLISNINLFDLLIFSITKTQLINFPNDATAFFYLTRFFTWPWLHVWDKSKVAGSPSRVISVVFSLPSLSFVDNRINDTVWSSNTTLNGNLIHPDSS